MNSDPPLAHRLRIDGHGTTNLDGSRWVPLPTSPLPRLSWVVPLVREGQCQRAFQVQVRAQMPGAGEPESASIVINTGVIESSDPWWQLDRPLEPLSFYTWQVRTSDEHDRWSEWSAPAPFETGPWAYSQWRADWVSVPHLHQVRLPVEIDQQPLQARVYLTAQGLVRASVDGQPVNGDGVDPSRTDYARALYRCYDITDLFTPGQHAVDFVLGHGTWAPTGQPPRLLATCVVHLPDGSVRHFGTREGLETTAGPVIIEEPFFLERHDHAMSDPVADRDVATVVEPVIHPTDAQAPPVRVQPDPGPPVRVTTTHPVTLIGQRDGRRVYDVGVNIAGRIHVRMLDSCPPGTEIRLVHGEHLGPDGGVDTTNLTLPHDHGRDRQVLECVLAGNPGELIEPWFSYAGFRYVEISGLPDAARVNVTATAVHSAVEPVATLETDAEIVQRLFAYAKRTLLNNVHGIPEDCPTREQAGWTGDTASVTEFEFSAFDMESFFGKWLGDLATSQSDDGAIPAIAPDLSPQRTSPDPVWGAALQRVLFGHWLHYGDRRLLDQHLPALRRWCDWLLGCVGAAGVVDGAPISYGHDWLGLVQTPPELHHTAAAVDAFDVLAHLEDECDRPEAAARAREQAALLRAAARTVFVDPQRHVIGNGSQGSLATALHADLINDDEREWAAAALEEAIRSRGNRVTSGFATTRAVVRGLAETGRDHVIADTLRQAATPGIGAMINSDMGTFWECWWIDPENTGTGSLDHIGLGGPFAGWALQYLAGVRPTSAGYGQFQLDPHPVDGVNQLHLTVDTVRGEIDLQWRRRGDHLDVEVSVPVSATAVVPGPDGARTLGAGHHRFALHRPAAPSCPPPPEPPWTAPYRAVPAADVDTDPLLDPAAAADAGSVDGSQVEVVIGGLRCMPVPHEQEPGPVLKITGPADTTTALASFDVDLDLSQASFVAARVDLCQDRSGRDKRAAIRLHGSDGSVLESTARLWPAGWSRVVAEINDWPGRFHVRRIDVGIVLLDEPGPESAPPTVHVAALGISGARRTW